MITAYLYFPQDRALAACTRVDSIHLNESLDSGAAVMSAVGKPRRKLIPLFQNDVQQNKAWGPL